MKKNVGNIDKIIRFVLAIIFVILIVNETITGIWLWILSVLAIILIVTGIIGWCGIYAALGIKTCSSPKK